MGVRDGVANKRRKKARADEEEEDAVATRDEKNVSNVDLDVSLSRDDVPDADAELPPGALRYKDIYIPPPPPSTCSFDNKGPRLVMKSIVVKNFKSFYGEHTIGPFFKGMSAVIGPNGSGKSNVLDSILFVFGYRASKIRTKKVSMLIHNSTRHTDLDSCSVTVNFIQIIDKGPNEDPEEVPNTNFAVSRTACRDNSSYYTMEGRRVQFKDVAIQLRTFGIDLTNGRFLILQGEVEQIAQMKPKGENEHDIGLLEFLEDITGTLRYREPLAKVNVINDELEKIWEEQAERVNVAEKHLKTLEEGKNEAIAYMKTENAITRLQHKLLQVIGYEIRCEMNACNEDKAKVNEELDEIKKELTEFEERIANYNAGMKERKESLEKEHQASEKLNAEYKKISKRDTELRETLKEHITRRKKAKEMLKKEEIKLEDLKALPEKNAGEIGELETMITRFEKERAEANKSLVAATEKLQKDSEEPQQELQKIEAELVTLAKNREEKASVHSINKSKLDLCTKQERQQQEKLGALKTNLNEASKNLKEKTKQLQVLEKEELPKLKQHLAETREQLEMDREERARVDQRAAKLLAELEGARTAAESAKYRNRVVAGLMEQSACGNIPGVFGRLGDLGGIDEKYDCAISSACGTLEYIVVDSMDTGEKCVQYLKDTKLGRANFIALDKMTQWETKCHQKMKTPENVPRLFDLVHVEDKRLLPAFYFALRDTLVAEDIEQATRIGLHGRERHRVVDLVGNIVEPGGTMTGGGAPIRGRMGQKVIAGLTEKSSSAINTPQMQNSMEQLNRRSTSLMENIIKLEQKERELRNKLPQIEAEAKRLTMDIKHLQKSIPGLEQQLVDQEEIVSKTSSDQKEVQHLQKELQHSTKELEAAAAAAGKLETQVTQLRKQLDEIKHKHMGSLDNKVKDLTKKINKAQAEKTKLAAAIASCERNMQKSEDKIQDLQQEVSGIETEMLEIKNELDSLGKVATANLSQKEAIGDRILTQDREMADFKKAHAGLNNEELAVRKRKVEIDHKMDKVVANAKRIKALLNDNEKKTKSLKLDDIPGDTVVDPFIFLSDEELAATTQVDVNYGINELKDAYPTKPNLDVIDEFRIKETQYIAMAEALEIATARFNESKNFIAAIKTARYSEFMKGFKIVNHKLKEVFRMISMGGDAELELQDTFNPFLEGIAFSVRPRNKAWTQIDRLSGGEKTLSSLALIFGLHYYKPSPFYMMDEIDAALDTRNVSIIGHYIKQFTTNCQFIVISLRPEMYDLFERRVVGIFKPDGCSRTVAVDPTKFQSVDSDVTEDSSLANHTNTGSTGLSGSITEDSHEINRQPEEDKRPVRSRKSVQPVLDDSTSSLSEPESNPDLSDVLAQESEYRSDSDVAPPKQIKRQRLHEVPPSDDES